MNEFRAVNVFKGLKEIIDEIEKHENFKETWEHMLETDAIEVIPLKKICATFYFMGFKDCLDESLEEVKK